MPDQERRSPAQWARDTLGAENIRNLKHKKKKEYGRALEKLKEGGRGVVKGFTDLKDALTPKKR
jgi:hypothetical protein